tara:strand:+ start:434 stop:637 length:204 start_codon:yes stop_codon:yes gene_type:complete
MKKSTPKVPGRSPKGFILGREHFAKISAVDGISLSVDMMDDFNQFDQLGLSPEERRRALARKYGKNQ